MPNKSNKTDKENIESNIDNETTKKVSKNESDLLDKKISLHTMELLLRHRSQNSNDVNKKVIELYRKQEEEELKARYHRSYDKSKWKSESPLDKARLYRPITINLNPRVKQKTKIKSFELPDHLKSRWNPVDSITKSIANPIKPSQSNDIYKKINQSKSEAIVPKQIGSIKNKDNARYKDVENARLEIYNKISMMMSQPASRKEVKPSKELQKSDPSIKSVTKKTKPLIKENKKTAKLNAEQIDNKKEIKTNDTFSFDQVNQNLDEIKQVNTDNKNKELNKISDKIKSSSKRKTKSLKEENSKVVTLDIKETTSIIKVKEQKPKVDANKESAISTKKITKQEEKLANKKESKKSQKAKITVKDSNTESKIDKSKSNVSETKSLTNNLDKSSDKKAAQPTKLLIINDEKDLNKTNVLVVSNDTVAKTAKDNIKQDKPLTLKSESVKNTTEVNSTQQINSNKKKPETKLDTKSTKKDTTKVSITSKKSEEKEDTTSKEIKKDKTNEANSKIKESKIEVKPENWNIQGVESDAKIKNKSSENENLLSKKPKQITSDNKSDKFEKKTDQNVLPKQESKKTTQSVKVDNDLDIVKLEDKSLKKDVSKDSESNHDQYIIDNKIHINEKDENNSFNRQEFLKSLNHKAIEIDNEDPNAIINNEVLYPSRKKQSWWQKIINFFKFKKKKKEE